TKKASSSSPVTSSPRSPSPPPTRKIWNASSRRESPPVLPSAAPIRRTTEPWRNTASGDNARERGWPLRRLSDREPRQILGHRNQRRMVEVPFPCDRHGVEQLTDERGDRHRHALLLARCQRDPQILPVKIDPKSGLELVGDH